jgi:hypothetical protein
MIRALPGPPRQITRNYLRRYHVPNMPVNVSSAQWHPEIFAALRQVTETRDEFTVRRILYMALQARQANRSLTYSQLVLASGARSNRDHPMIKRALEDAMSGLLPQDD